MKRAAISLTVTLLGSLVGVGTASADLARLLRESRYAESRHSYAGTKVVQRFRPGEDEPAHETVVRVFHRAPDQTRLEFVRGGPPGGLILQVGDHHYFAREGVFWRVPRRPPPDRLDLMLQNYELTHPRRACIAGRTALRIRIEPRHAGNPRKIVWVDLRTRLILRTELFDCRGQRREAVFFQEIDYRPELPQQLFAVSGEVREPPPEEPVTADFEPLRPRYVPPGYQLDGTRVWKARGSVVVYLRYTDGLNTLSLFQTRGGESMGDRGPRFRGQEPIRGQVGAIRFLLVGDLRREELQKMADSLLPR